MTTDAQIQLTPAIYNGTITKLEKRIAASWGQLQRAVQSKDIAATRAAVNRVAHLEELRQKHVALERSIAETISNGAPSQTAPVLESISNGSSTQIAFVPESISDGSPSQSAPVPERGTIDLSIQSAPVFETRPNGPSIQTAPVPESISNGSSNQAAPVPEKGIDLPQPDVQSPVTRPKRKPVRPVEIKFGSVKKHIRYATEIPVTIANWLIEQGKELPISANFIHPSEAGFSQSAVTKKLKSGQFMRVGHNQEALLHKARELLDGCGYEGVQIKVLLDNGITLSA